MGRAWDGGRRPAGVRLRTPDGPRRDPAVEQACPRLVSSCRVSVLFVTDERCRLHVAGAHHPERPERLTPSSMASSRRGCARPSCRTFRLRRRSRRWNVSTTRRTSRPSAPSASPGVATSTRTRAWSPPRTRRRCSRPVRARRHRDACGSGVGRRGPVRGATPGPPRPAGAGDGLLPVQQHRRRRGIAGRRRASASWSSTVDVHHGNGTEEMFFARPRRRLRLAARVAALPGDRRRHRRRPGTRAPAPRSTSPCLPAPPATSTGRRSTRWSSRSPMPSSPPGCSSPLGFDAHRADPLAGVSLSAGDFGAIVSVLRRLWSPQAGAWPCWRAGTTWRRSLTRRRHRSRRSPGSTGFPSPRRPAGRGARWWTCWSRRESAPERRSVRTPARTSPQRGKMPRCAAGRPCRGFTER